ncbi:hypothetical protein [Thermomonospora umbrina]|uniref:Lipoprotein n=1 Tax=Thermomonospora umbrina TaxID=111806 RepID=A0A3D9SQN9_9ACTN|nr:hypothetical protein [Thermomonospora umbrina]REE98098.1 hypothetical protein DFJ69_3582 [Thermomonospora umbrina]
MYRRLTATAAVCGALTLSLTGCLGSAEEKAGDAGGAVKLAAAQILAKVSDKAGSADSYRVKLTSDSRLSIQGQQMSVRMDMDMEVRHRPVPAMRGSMTTFGTPGGGRPVKMIMVGRSLYMNHGSTALSGGKPWARMPVGDGAAGGSDPLEEMERNGPGEQARVLTASPNVRVVGRETVDGVVTTRYAGTLNPATDFARMPPEHREKYEGIYRKLKAQRVSIELWVGDDGLPRRQKVDMTLAVGAVTAIGTFFDYGKPVKVSAPPDDQVGEFTSPSLPNIPRA